MNKRLLFAAGLLIVTGCGGSNAPIVPAHSNVIASTFNMHWPARTSPQARRRPNFISPSAQSVVVEVNGDSALTTVSNRPAGSGPVDSTVTVLTPPGNDTFVFSLYDQQNAGGNELGQQSVVQTIAPAKNNVIHATIDGLVSTVQIAPAANQPTVIPTTAPDGKTVYAVLGDVPVSFVATPLDADGNIILTSGDPISYTAATQSTSVTLTPLSGKANEFSIRASGLANSASSLDFTITATDGQGSFAQSNASLSLAELIYVAYENSGNGTVAALNDAGNRVSLPGSFPGLVDPKGIAYDSADHRLYIADKGANAVLAFNSDGTPLASGYTPPALNGPFAITYDDHNDVLYALDSTGVHAMNPNGSAATLTTTGTPFANLIQPSAIAIYEAPPSTYWIYVADAGDNMANRYDELGNPEPVGARRQTTFSLGSLVPTGVTCIASTQTTFAGNVSGTGQLAQYPGPGSTSFPPTTQTAGLSSPSAIAYDAVSALYFVTNASSGTITTYDRTFAGVLTTFAPSANLSTPSALTFVY